jgi:hypothetical protein
VDGELGALCPACVAPAVAQAAGGAMGAADQPGELVEGDGVLLRDESEELLISFRDLKAAPVPACSPSTFFPFGERLWCQCLSSFQIRIALTYLCVLFLVLPLPLVCLLCASLPWFVTTLARLPRVRESGHERDAAGAANGSETKPQWLSGSGSTPRRCACGPTAGHARSGE